MSNILINILQPEPTCPCGASLVGRRSNVRYCHVECRIAEAVRKQRAKIERQQQKQGRRNGMWLVKCAFCGGEFGSKRKPIKGKPRYCPPLYADSEASPCRQAAYRKRASGGK